jgi:hypothetical protein
MRYPYFSPSTVSAAPAAKKSGSAVRNRCVGPPLVDGADGEVPLAVVDLDVSLTMDGAHGRVSSMSRTWSLLAITTTVLLVL